VIEEFSFFFKFVILKLDDSIQKKETSSGIDLKFIRVACAFFFWRENFTGFLRLLRGFGERETVKLTESSTKGW